MRPAGRIFRLSFNFRLSSLGFSRSIACGFSTSAMSTPNAPNIRNHVKAPIRLGGGSAMTLVKYPG